MSRLKPDQTFYPTPREAVRGPPETIAYVAGLYTGTGLQKPDFLAVVDVDPKSDTYSQILHRVELPEIGDELHHFGWNACSSMLCPYGDPTLERRYLIVPGLRSSNVYVIDTKPDPRRPTLVKKIRGERIREVSGYSRIHTVHCGPDAVYLSGLGGTGDEGPGGVLLLDHRTLEPLGRFEIDRGDQYLAYDFWWHLTEEVMISSEWTVPKYFENGLDLDALVKGLYGNRIHFWDLRKRKHLKSIELGKEQRMVLELRPFHEPTKLMGFANVVISVKDLSSSIWLWHKEDNRWDVSKVIEIEAVPLEENLLPGVLKPFGAVPPLVTDIVLSVDDRYLYVSCWGTGELRCYDVSNPFEPKLKSIAKLGGIVHRADHPSGRRLTGAPQMVEVSRDGRRVYVTNSLYSSWDPIFYPEGLYGWLVKLNSEGGQLSVDDRFFVDFGQAKAHQVRLEGGDSSSDSFCYPSA
ncbi:MAG: selenium-binding family protein [Thaumarchaeota archaeon]|nr:selenium-binding family protein [Candidatus Calditenuaceae archaeon]MDW8186724.1 selenium-binding protein SBP56-related protein [Nitrososphaerota archaeon]